MVFPLRPLAALVPRSLLFHSHEDDIPPPYSETAGDRRAPSSFPNMHTSASFHPADPAADMEWRRYPNLPSAYPPTPLLTSSRSLNPHSVSGHVGADPSAAGPYEIWVPPVVEEDEEEQNDLTTTRIVPMELRSGQPSFSRSLLPHRVPLHPGLGNHDGLSDESDKGVEYKAPILAGIRRDYSQSSGDEAKDMEVDSEDNRQYESDGDDDAELESDDDSFNVTLQTPRVPLSLQPSSATASRSTIRMRASARSVFTELERETEGKRHSTGSALLPFLDTTSNSVKGKSSPSSIDSESVSISSGDQMSMLQSKSKAHPGLSQVPGPLLIPLFGTENEDITSDSSLGSAPGIDPITCFSTPNAQGRKRSHSRSFPQKEKDLAGPSLQHLSSVESISSSSSSHAPSDVEEEEGEEDLPAVASTSTPKNRPVAAVKHTHSLRSAGRAAEETFGAAESDEGEARAQEVHLTGTRKRRKVISSSSASGQGGTSNTSESEPAPSSSRVSSGRKPLSVEKGQEKALLLPSSRTSRASRPRKQPSESVSEEIYDRPKTKGKGKAPTTTKASGSSAPTRKRSHIQAPKSTQSTTSLKIPSLVKISSSTLRMTRSTSNTESFDIDERSDVGSGLEADDYPLHVARERVKRQI